ncbi:MAG: metallophosphoesterase, partial [Planctomycetes bacterium]|nr:metallophosphoesterase [Planctomycetota bacterium]
MRRSVRAAVVVSSAPNSCNEWYGRRNVFAVISDIHGNLEALLVALEDIGSRSIKQIYCLGDIVGYGASPRECLDLVVERCEVMLCG